MCIVVGHVEIRYKITLSLPHLGAHSLVAVSTTLPVLVHIRAPGELHGTLQERKEREASHVWCHCEVWDFVSSENAGSLWLSFLAIV